MRAETPTPRYEPYRGPISDGATIEGVGSEVTAPVEEAGTGEPSPPLYDGAPIVYVNEDDDAFEEIRAMIGLIHDSGSPDAEPSEDDEPPEDDPPPSAPDSAVPWWLEEGKEDGEDKLAA